MRRRTARAAVTAALMLVALTACGGEGDTESGGGGEAGQATGGVGGSDSEKGERPLKLVEADTTAEVAAIVKEALGPCIRFSKDKHQISGATESNYCTYESEGGVATLEIHLIDNAEREQLHREHDSVGYLLYGKGFMIDFDSDVPQQQPALEGAGLLYLNCEEGFDAYVKANEGVKKIRTVKAITTGCRYTKTDLTRFM
ncbi:hypothetical protein G5C51_30275 [Streptomyces sp. A7024]|uniref:Lipoprotein n=1 Tax=Streptomyces coryli TaxID=1128680 RepID=A0A6G4U7L5_9ACTN|nr:hypothetical protein [Streptomyces coryli]NGN68174.1 hypothetical protein [Streptomyces coryli]